MQLVFHFGNHSTFFKKDIYILDIIYSHTYKYTLRKICWESVFKVMDSKCSQLNNFSVRICTHFIHIWVFYYMSADNICLLLLQTRGKKAKLPAPLDRSTFPSSNYKMHSKTFNAQRNNHYGMLTEQRDLKVTHIKCTEGYLVRHKSPLADLQCEVKV